MYRRVKRSRVHLTVAERRCDRELADVEGYAPAHYAAQEGHAECLRALLEGGGASGLEARDHSIGSSPVNVQHLHALRH
eukprot:8235803-Pyramimonas_sp.AAC.1